MPTNTPTPADVEAFMLEARTRYALALAADQDDATDGKDDVVFVDGKNQWAEKARKRREKRKEPILTWNRLPTFVAQVNNDGRQNKPSMRVAAMDGGDPKTASVQQDRLRHIEYEADADVAYDTSRRQQIVSGRGFYRVGTEYKPGSMDQRVTIEPIENQFSVLWDTSARKYDRSDADWCFVFSWMSKDSYRREYGDKEADEAISLFANDSNPAPDWLGVGPNGEMIQVAEYWVKTHTPYTRCTLPDLSSCRKKELPEGFDEHSILEEREDDDVTVTQYIINGIKPLAETEFPVPFIPIVSLWGEQMVVDGKRCNYSLVRNAKDPQRLVNLYVSNIAGECARMGKAMYIIAAGQILGFEDDWEEINDDPKSAIQYKAQDVGGTQVPPPHREVYEPPIQALTLGLNQAIDAMKAAMGIYDDSLGVTTNEKSGVAIQARKKQTQVSNFHFADNEGRSRKYCGKIVLALVRVLDKGPREVPTRSEDGKTKLIKVNQPSTDAKTGQPVHHDITQDGEIAISSGPSYDSEREQAADQYGQIAAADKNFMPWAGDLFFRTLDMPGADAIADRYEKMLPAALQPPDPTGEKQKAAQAAQNAQAVQLLQQQHGLLVNQVHQMAQVIEQKQIEAKNTWQVKCLDSWTRLRMAEITAGVQTGIADADREGDRLEGMFDRAHEVGQAAMAHQNTVMQTAQQQDGAAASQATAAQTAQQSQQAQQDHASGMQQNAQDASAAAAEQAQQNAPPAEPAA